MALPNLTDSGQNPADIAQAIANQVESDSLTISGHKQQAQTDQETITNTLLPQAQSDASTIASLVSSAPTADVLNLDLGVFDITSHFQPVSGVALHSFSAYLFHKFVFLAVEFESTNDPGAGTSDLANILASSLYPATATPFPVIGYQGDTAEFVRIETTGGIKLFHATNLSHTSWIATINGFYKIV